jgi:amino acid transporter
MTALFYWIAQPIWLGGLLTATAVAAINSLIVTKPLGTASEIIFGIIFVWAVIAGAIIAMKYGKLVPNIGAVLKFILTLLFVGLAVAFLVTKGKPPGTLTPSGLAPSVTGFLALIGILLYMWVGQELATGATEEMVNPRRDIPRMVFGGGALTVATYVIFIVFILLVIPGSALTNVSSFTDTLSHVNGVLGSAQSWANTLIGILVVVVLLSEGVAWIMGSDRIQAVAAIDGAAPAWMRKFTSFGTPIAVNLTSGTVGTAFVILGFTLTSGKLAAFFSVMLGLAISTSTISYLFVFPSLLMLRRRYPGIERPFRIPGGTAGVAAAVILTEGVAFLTCLTFLWPGLVNAWFGESYSITAAYGVSRALFEGTTFGTLGVITCIGLAFWVIGQRQIRRGRAGEPDLIAAAGVAPGQATAPS